jgi:PhzF family phenazine biosynthesis protein
MKKQRIFKVDAFSNGLFTGNPAGVCILEHQWLPDRLMQLIAMENNLAETAFVINSPEGMHIRWFTPAVEVDLCGHASLAAAHVLFAHLAYPDDALRFNSCSGILTVTKDNDRYTLDFPCDDLRPAEVTREMSECIHREPEAAFFGKTDLMLMFGDEAMIADARPDYPAIERFDVRGVIITAPGREVDFVSRFFAPQSGVHEDPVTGSAHTTLTPYWSRRLAKKDLTAMQLSPRKGWLRCHNAGTRIYISGKAETYLDGMIALPGDID